MIAPVTEEILRIATGELDARGTVNKTALTEMGFVVGASAKPKAVSASRSRRATPREEAAAGRRRDAAESSQGEKIQGPKQPLLPTGRSSRLLSLPNSSAHLIPIPIPIPTRKETSKQHRIA